MKVYLVYEITPNKNMYLEGVFSTNKLADAYIQSLVNATPVPALIEIGAVYTVETWTVDEER